MTKPYNPKLETRLKKLHYPLAQPRFPNQNNQITINNQIYNITIHDNGVSYNKKRKRKVLVYSRQGLVSARRFFYHLYHPRWNGEGKIIHKDQNDLNFKKSNLVLLSERECNNLVHFNNNLIFNNKILQQTAISIVKLRITVADARKEVRKNEERY